jgi:hypothetical protein
MISTFPRFCGVRRKKRSSFLGKCFLRRPGIDGTPFVLTGNAILLNGVVKTANREIGVPGFQSKSFTQTFEAQFKEDAPKRSIGKMCR